MHKQKTFPLHLFCLHGFLGEPQEWNFLSETVQEKKFLHCIDLYGKEYAKPIEGLWPWAASFNRSVSAACISEDKILVGYSLGGRLALHSLLHQPSLWKAAIIISSSVGNLSDEEKITRKVSDALWAERFSCMDWEEVVSLWNSQPLFCQSPPLVRPQTTSRNNLTTSLTHWSQTTQQDLTDQLKALTIPILWIVGENDVKYVAIARSLQFSHPLSSLSIIAKAGHRLHLENTKECISVIHSFFNSLINS